MIGESTFIIFDKALYSLQYSVLLWNERFSGCVRYMVIFKFKLEPDIWIRQKIYIYEYIAVYVDSLAIVERYPKIFMDELLNKYKFNIKGMGPI